MSEQQANAKQNSDNKPFGNNNRRNKPLNGVIIVLLVVLAVGVFQNIYNPNYATLQGGEEELFKLMRNGHVAKLEIASHKRMLYIYLNEAGKKAKKITSASTDNPDFQLYIGLKFEENFSKDCKTKDVTYIAPTALPPNLMDRVLHSGLLGILFNVLLLLGIGYLFFGDVLGSSIGGGSSSQIIWGKKNKTGVTFKSIQGMVETKKQVRDIVDYFKYPERYLNIGATPPKGAILIGPPGTGKTLLAKAIAGEANVPFFSASGSDFEEIFVGLGAKRIRKLFASARKHSPCIIFIDEIDTIGYKRSSGAVEGGQSDAANTLNQLLNELDGFKPNERIFFLATTNREKVIDKALLRSGRLGRKVYTNLPAINEREETFAAYAAKIKTADHIDVKELAKQTPYFSYADIAEITNDAALIAVSKRRKAVTMEDFNEAINQNIGGIVRDGKMLKGKEKKIVAIHEAGHALVAHHMPNATPLVKVTIMPRTNAALGFAQYEPEEKHIHQEAYLLDEICTLLGGRAAEQFSFGEASTGAQNDFERVKKILEDMYAVYGMLPQIGPLSYYDSTSAGKYSFTKPFSEQRGQEIDKAITQCANKLLAQATQLITKHQDQLFQIADALMEKEELSGEEVRRILGPRPKFKKPKNLFEDYLSKKDA
ncbi:MAG: AAA family ATPase [Bacteroidota bacterium]